MEGAVEFARFGTGSPFHFVGSESSPPSFGSFEPSAAGRRYEDDAASLDSSNSLLDSVSSRVDCQHTNFRFDTDGADSLPGRDDFDGRPTSGLSMSPFDGVPHNDSGSMAAAASTHSPLGLMSPQPMLQSASEVAAAAARSAMTAAHAVRTAFTDVDRAPALPAAPAGNRFLFDAASGADVGFAHCPKRGLIADRHLPCGTLVAAFVEPAYSGVVSGAFKFPNRTEHAVFPVGTLATQMTMPVANTMPNFALVPAADLAPHDKAGLRWVAGLRRRHGLPGEMLRDIDAFERSEGAFGLVLVALRDVAKNEVPTLLPLSRPSPAEVRACAMRLPWFARRLVPSVATIAMNEGIEVQITSACAVMLRERFKLPRIANDCMAQLLWQRVSVVADVLLAFGVVRQSPRLWNWVRPGTKFPDAWQRAELFTNYERLLEPSRRAAAGGGGGAARGGGGGGCGGEPVANMTGSADHTQLTPVQMAAAAAMARHAHPGHQAKMET